ncbi:MAG: DUF5908 family protein [Bacteroidetes bacterium]|nr:DUF5908 family protein [Bacteroidota bacterium]
MPVEIRELQITTQVQEPSSPSTPATPASAPAVNKDEIIAACVEQVMEILKLKNER